MKKRILIFGNGQIGNFYFKYFNKKGWPVKVAKADILDTRQIKRAVKSFKPDVVINTAGVTNLEVCSKERLRAFNVNVLGADNLAKACDENKIYFIHFSSGCIFQSKNVRDIKKEGDEPEPAAYYSWTKVWSENLVTFEKSPSFKYVILRPRQPVSAEMNHKNMLFKFLTFTRFIDIANSGTVLEDLVEWTEALIKKKFVGVIHVANEGYSTPYRIGLLIKKHILPRLDVKKISKAELNKLTPNRRVDTLLDVSKLKKLGIKVERYDKRLEEIIIKLGKNIRQADKKKLEKELKLTLGESKQRTITNKCMWDLIK